MAGITSFKVSVFTRNTEKFPEVAARAEDLTPVFNNIIEEWVLGNERKFSRGMGKSASGAQQDAYEGGEAFWQPLTSRYRRSKENDGFPDWLMVRTGELMDTMTTRGKLAERIEAQHAVFGMPLDEEQAIKVEGNWKRRQAIMLDKTDRLMIKREVKNYLDLGGDYKDILFARGVAMAAARQEAKAMDAEFKFRMGGN